MDNNEQPPSLRIIEDFLSSDELEFWSSMMREDSVWNQPHPHEHRGSSMGRPGPVYESPYIEAYYALLEKTCSTMESIYEEPLVTSRGPSFRRYTEGDEIALHYDYARDGSGEILQLRDETRRPGEMAPYPAGLHDVQSVLYFNDDYEGGLVRFGSGSWIRPKAGMMITWPSTHKYGHGISVITSGVRFISAMFWIRAKTLAIASHSDLLSENWRDTMMWPEKVDKMLGL